MKRVRCRCKTNARMAKYGMKGSKSVNYWKPCPIHDKADVEVYQYDQKGR